MIVVRRVLLGVAVVQIASTMLGATQLLLWPAMYEPVLAPTPLAGQFVLAAVLLGGAVGGAQWAALAVHLRRPAWLHTAHAAAGTVMVGWIAGECLVLDSFIWAHALWGGLGMAQVLLVLVLLGVLRRRPEPAPGGAALTTRPTAPPRHAAS